MTLWLYRSHIRHIHVRLRMQRAVEMPGCCLHAFHSLDDIFADGYVMLRNEALMCFEPGCDMNVEAPG